MFYGIQKGAITALNQSTDWFTNLNKVDVVQQQSWLNHFLGILKGRIAEKAFLVFSAPLDYCLTTA